MTPDPVAPDHARRNRNRAMLLAIFALFFGSLFIAGALRFSGWRPSGMKNKGEMLNPPADLRAVTPVLLDGSAYQWQPINRTWRIALAPPADCGSECSKAAHDIHVVWELLGREASRVDVLWLCASEPCALPAGAPKLANLRLLRSDAGLRAKLPRADAVTHAGGRGVPVYVIDPNGFVILRYAAGSDPGDLRSDLAKLLKLRVFSDAQGKMNLSLADVQGGLLLVSQFTLAADTRRGNRPSFTGAAPAELGERLYDRAVATARAAHGQVATGRFGADMKVHLVNDGPVTIPMVLRAEA